MKSTYFRHAALTQGDIRNTPTGMLLRESGLRVGDCGVVIEGPPCQGHSTSGKR
jgi:site-specific DNA-cytosine methylase